MQYTKINGRSKSGLGAGFVDFRLDFWISDWISRFHLDFWISDWISRFHLDF